MGIFGEINYHFKDNKNYNLKLNFFKGETTTTQAPATTTPAAPTTTPSGTIRNLYNIS